MNTFNLQAVTVLVTAIAFVTPTVISAKTGEILPDPIISKIQTRCVTGGCSGEICADASSGPLYSTCQWKEEYACLPKAKCEVQSSGKCGWTYTEEYNQCMTGDPIQPVITPEPKNSCGNTICEAGEADSIEGGCPDGSPDSCLGPPLRIINGTCPADCPTPTIHIDPTIIPTLEATPTPTTVPTVTTTITPTRMPTSEQPQIIHLYNPSNTGENVQRTQKLISSIGILTPQSATVETPKISRSQFSAKVDSAITLSFYERIINHIHSLIPHYFN